MLTPPIVGALCFTISITFKSEQGLIGLFKTCVKPQQLVILAQQTPVYMSNIAVAYNHDRVTWRAELSVQALNIQTKFSFCKYKLLYLH